MKSNTTLVVQTGGVIAGGDTSHSPIESRKQKNPAHATAIVHVKVQESFPSTSLPTRVAPACLAFLSTRLYPGIVSPRKEEKVLPLCFESASL